MTILIATAFIVYIVLAISGIGVIILLGWRWLK